MTTQKKFSLFSMIVVSLVVQSCIKDNDFDYDKIAASTWNPDVAVPLIHSTMTIQDIIASGDSSIVAIDSNHLVSLIYRGKIYSISGNELFQFVDQTDFTPFTFNTGDSSTLYSTNEVTKTIPKTTSFNFPGAEQIDSININENNLKNLYFDLSVNQINTSIDIQSISFEKIPYKSIL